MSDQRIKRFGHMAIAQVPGFNPTAKHRAVVPFGIKDQACILFGEEEFILRNSSITAGVVRRPASQLDQLLDNIAFA